VDCNDLGDCIIAGQKYPKIWWASAGSDFSKMRNWNKVPTVGVSGMGHNRGISFPGPDVAYVVGGSTNNASGVDGYIIKTEDKGRNWTAVLSQNSSTSSLAGIDCYDSLHCVAVGGMGTVLITSDGGLRWEDWETLWPGDPVIGEAKANDVRFLGVAYPNADTVIAVGYVPNTDGSVKNGVIYALGEREDCDEQLPVCGGTSDTCTGFHTAVWNEQSTAGVGPQAYYAGQSLVRITGKMLFRDPIATHNNEPNVMHNACRSEGSGYGGVSGELSLFVDFAGHEEEFRFNRVGACGDVPVGEVGIDLYVPENSRIALTTPRNGFFAGPGWDWSGTDTGCSSNFPRRYYDVSNPANRCLNGYAWSQVTNKTGFPTVTSCGFDQECRWDYNEDPNLWYGGGCDKNGLDRVGLGCSGLCFAHKYGYTMGGVPCGAENPRM